MAQEANPKEEEQRLDQLAAYLQDGGTIQLAYNIKDDEMEAMFAAAYQYLQGQRWQEAADSYLFLTFLNPYDTRYWVGLGESLRNNDEAEKALDAYRMASLCDHDDPRPYFHCATCLMTLGRAEAAAEMLKLSIEHSEGKDEFAAVKSISHELMEDLHSKVGIGG